MTAANFPANGVLCRVNAELSLRENVKHGLLLVGGSMETGEKKSLNSLYHCNEPVGSHRGFIHLLLYGLFIDLGISRGDVH